MPAEHQGAYGFRFEGIAPAPALAVRGIGAFPPLHVQTQVVDDEDRGPDRVDEDEASIATTAARLLLDRPTGRVIVRASEPVPEADLVHPCLWPAAAVFARWRGKETLHAGAFLDRQERAWVVMGASSGGKSSLLARLALDGHDVLADDMVVLDGRQGFTGPRCVDLKPDAAARLGVESATLTVRSTQRRRLALGPADAVFPVSGFIYLAWGTETATSSVPPAQHLGWLVQHRRVAVLGLDPHEALDLAGLPALLLVRPRQWEAFDSAYQALMKALVAQS